MTNSTVREIDSSPVNYHIGLQVLRGTAILTRCSLTKIANRADVYILYCEGADVTLRDTQLEYGSDISSNDSTILLDNCTAQSGFIIVSQDDNITMINSDFHQQNYFYFDRSAVMLAGCAIGLDYGYGGPAPVISLPTSEPGMNFTFRDCLVRSDNFDIELHHDDDLSSSGVRALTFSTPRNCLVSNCTFDGFWCGVGAADARTARVANSTFMGDSMPIDAHWYSKDELSISGNNFMTGVGLTVVNGGATVENNTINNNYNYGEIRCDGASRINGNKMTKLNIETIEEMKSVFKNCPKSIC